MSYIRLSDGTIAHVRFAKGHKISVADVKALEEIRAALQRQKEWTGGDPLCNHESDGEGTCLGCGAQKQSEVPR